MRLTLSQQIIDTCLAMNSEGINQGTAGNVSIRFEDGFLITPSAVAYNKLVPGDIVYIEMDGSALGRLRPSSEWRMHLDIYATRPEAEAVIHVHSTFATALSCLRKDIPAFHYMVAVAGGKDIKCSNYALFGTQDLSDTMLKALNDRCACLLGTHGMICFHDSLDKALWLAVEVETLAKQYWYACQAGEPVLLSDAQITEVLEKFKNYHKHSGNGEPKA